MGEVRANLDRQSVADLDLDQINLLRLQVDQKFNELKAQLADFVALRKDTVEKVMIERGVTNATIRFNMLRIIDKEASDETEIAAREYNRGIEELSLLERKVQDANRSWWKKLFNRK